MNNTTLELFHNWTNNRTQPEHSYPQKQILGRVNACNKTFNSSHVCSRGEKHSWDKVDAQLSTSSIVQIEHGREHFCTANVKLGM
jgi:hypothetical protein